MSNILSRFLTDTCTVWRSSGQPNDFGQIAFGAAEQIKCCHQEGGKLTTDSDGNQFVPMAEFDMYDAGVKIGDLVAFGEHAGSPQDAPAHKVRKIIIATELRGRRDVTVLTG